MEFGGDVKCFGYAQRLYKCNAEDFRRLASKVHELWPPKDVRRSKVGMEIAWYAGASWVLMVLTQNNFGEIDMICAHHPTLISYPMLRRSMSYKESCVQPAEHMQKAG